MKCEFCLIEHDGSYGSGRFCSKTCSRKFSTFAKRAEINLKVSETNKRKGIGFTVRGTGPGWKDPVIREKAHRVQRNKNAQRRENTPFGRWRKVHQYDFLLAEQNSLCAICCMPNTWNEKPLKFHIDHIDGDHTNEQRDNHRLVCPNCHSQTPTYCGRNIKLKKSKLVADAGIEPATVDLESTALPLS